MDEEVYKLKKIIHFLENVKGRHTELVTVYVPAGANLDIIKNQLASEADTASNIKSKSVRTNVTTSIERMVGELKHFKKTPDKGMALFSGNVSDTEGKTDFNTWVIIPPEPINIKLYRCDSRFVIEPLKELIEAKNVYGLIVLDHREANFALLKGKSITNLQSMDSMVMGKFKAGGQSAARFAREREEQIKHFFKDVADKARIVFQDVKNLKGIILGGPGPAKDDFYGSSYIPDAIKKKIVGVKDVSDTSENGIRELVHKSEKLLAEEEIIAEKKNLDEFFTHLAKDDGLASYGEAEVKTNLRNGVVERLLLSEALEEKKIEEFIDFAKNFSTEVIFVSEDTPEGVQLRELGGYGAILRYKS